MTIRGKRQTGLTDLSISLPPASRPAFTFRFLLATHSLSSLFPHITLVSKAYSTMDTDQQSRHSRLSRKSSVTSRQSQLIKKSTGGCSHHMLESALRASSLTIMTITAATDLRPSDILIERFEAWKNITKNLIAYFEGELLSLL